MRSSIKTIMTLLLMGLNTPAMAAGDHYVGAGLGAFTLNNGKPNNSAATINTNYKGLEANTYTAAIKYHF